MKLFEPIRIIARSGDPYRNPIVLALSRHKDPRFNRNVGNRVRAVLGEGLMVASLVSLSIVTFLLAGVCLVPIANLILVSVPVMFAIYANNLTAHMVSSGSYQLIRLSPLKPIERVWGLFFASLHHVRFLVMLSVAALPVNPVVAIVLALYGIADLSLIITVTLITISAVGMAMVGILAGIAASLKLEESVQAISISTGFTLLVTLLLVAGIWGLSAVWLLWLAVILALIPYGLIIGSLHLAERWA